ncbi:DUF4328 domain-containing protein [Streptomyces hainanensis]|nr:DUF4328 domain-containing protein [Streptomyces hainanensis]
MPGMPYAGYPYPMPTGPAAVFASPRGLATAVSVLLGVTAALYLLMTVGAMRMWSTVGDMQDGNFPTLQEAEDVDDFYFGTIMIAALGLLATGIVFIVWFYRIRVNAELFDPTGQRLSRGWAIGAWFTPVVSLWFPKQMANDIWRASTPWGANPAHGVVTAWWTLWIASTVSYVAARAQIPENEALFSSEDLDTLRNQSSALGLSGMLGVAAAVVAILFVRQISARQQTKYAQGPIPPGGQPPVPGPQSMPGQQPGAYPAPGQYPAPGTYPAPGGYPAGGAYPPPGGYPQPGAYPPPSQGAPPYPGPQPGQPPMTPPG